MILENLELCWRTHELRRFPEFPLSQRARAGLREGRISILTPDRGRSPSAVCRPAEADCRKSVILCLAMRCEPGRRSRGALLALRKPATTARIRAIPV